MQDDTVNAAAVVLAAAARSTTGLLPHHQQVDDQACAATKPRWWSRVKAKLLCFRPLRHGHSRRIAAASPEPMRQISSNSYCTHHATQPTTVAFAAPPPSPASSSLFTSGAPSPVQVLRLDASSSYSSPTTASMFAIGPYAREPQQLVSPPAFSAGLTEPSTAPLTPPPESAGGLQLLVAGSSPEVPFARFLLPSFQGYQLQPGSPIGGTLVLSPASTTSSPPAWLHHRRNQEGPVAAGSFEAGSEEGCSARRKPSGEFVFGSAAGEWTTTFADADGGERRSSTSMADDAAEGGNRQWPFCSSFPS